jgi:hypothetical protein
LYVPAVRPAVDTFTVTELGAVPPVGFTDSHAWFTVAVQFRAPPLASVFVMLSTWDAGSAPPSTPLKLRLLGLTPSAGGSGIVNVAISTNARSASGKKLVEVLPPTTTPNRGLFNDFTTLPGS